MTVSLRPITKENWQPVYWLSETLTAEQRGSDAFWKRNPVLAAKP